MTPPRPTPAMFHIDVTANSGNERPGYVATTGEEVVGLLAQILATQQKQAQLLEELVQQMSASQRQRTAELGHWKQANPALARSCRAAAESLSRVQTQFLHNLTEEITDNSENLMDGEFLLNEFVDRFGPRLAHLNGVLQVLSQLSSVPSPTNAQ
jgi:predicted DsbA family dithiol-disulfide isomerase